MTSQLTIDAGAEFDRQVDNLVERDYPTMAGLARERFDALVAPLRDVVAKLHDLRYEPDAGHAPFLIVVTRQVVPIERAMSRTTLHGRHKAGTVDGSFEPGALERFVATEQTQPPDPRAYLLLDIDRGEEFCGAVPNDAMATIAARGRTPLTIEEGIALITHFPQLLVKNKCFSLGGSRSSDRRVPALWISQHAPKLGWCWAGNPHTWLGMASAGERKTAA
jgi:hypothetical protein